MKTECIRKSLTSDFKNVGMAIGIILGLIIACYLFGYLLNVLGSMKIVIGAYEAFIIFGIIAVVLGFAINLISNNKNLVNFGTFPNYMIGIMFVLVLYGCYCISSWSHCVDNGSWFPDVNLLFVIFILAGIVLTPFALVYVRCKEEVGVE